MSHLSSSYGAPPTASPQLAKKAEPARGSGLLRGGWQSGETGDGCRALLPISSGERRALIFAPCLARKCPHDRNTLLSDCAAEPSQLHKLLLVVPGGLNEEFGVDAPSFIRLLTRPSC